MWKPIPDFPDYEASDSGLIRNSVTGRVRNIKARNCNGTGYYMTPMRVNGQWRLRTVHRLVAAAFLGPCPSGREVNHKNSNKLDNCADNLEYVTHQQNSRHHFDTRTRPDPRESFSPAMREQILIELKSGCTQNSLATKYGVAQATISKIARGKGYKWVKNNSDS